MAGHIKWRLIFCIAYLIFNIDKANSSADIIKKMTAAFGNGLKQCKEELTVADNIMQDFYNFWREEYSLLNREMGCVIICMASKMDLVKVDEYKMHHENAHAFAKSHGADDELAKQLVDMIHDCEKQFADNADHCAKALEVAKCFRTKIHALNWAPDMETLLEEIMSDAKNI